MGTQFSVHEYTSGTRSLTPPRILPHPVIVNDTAPQERWNYDVMELEGEARFMEIVTEIKKMAADLNPGCKCISLPLYTSDTTSTGNFPLRFLVMFLGYLLLCECSDEECTFSFDG